MKSSKELEIFMDDSLEGTLTRIREFDLPEKLEASEPPEARGLDRDQVRLMISHYTDNTIEHASFVDLPDYLQPGDTIVINTSGTMNAAVYAVNQEGLAFELHISSVLPSGQSIIELRQTNGQGSKPFFHAQPGDKYRIPEDGSVLLIKPYRHDQSKSPTVRLWIAHIDIPISLDSHLNKYGFPIRYSYIRQKWPLSFYQTIYATQIGSAEMPSAGCAFTPQLITRLVAKGIWITPVLLHTDVSSLENHELPPEEYYRVPPDTAILVNTARERGKHIVAVGTTTVRALESVSTPNGIIHAGEGWTDLVITPQRGLFSVNALLTGFHEPLSSHLDILVALTGEDHIARAYQQALENAYLWHEFGDLHLIIPRSQN